MENFSRCAGDLLAEAGEHLLQRAGIERTSAFRLSAYTEVDLYCYDVAARGCTEKSQRIHFPEGWIGREGGYVNLHFAQGVLWEVLRKALEAFPLEAGWEKEESRVDFSPIPYALGRLRMELFAAMQTACVPRKVLGEAGTGIRELLVRCISHSLWREDARVSRAVELARRTAEQLEKQNPRDAQRLLLWRGLAKTLQVYDAPVGPGGVDEMRWNDDGKNRGESWH